MGIKAALSKPFAKLVVSDIRKWSATPIETQNRVFSDLISKAKDTVFGKDHHFEEISNYEDFKQRVPVRDYEALKPYIKQVVDGKEDVLWPGKPIYLCKTSGTTSGAKYIPLTKASMPNHIDSARNAILCYIHETGKTGFVDGKMIFLQGSPELDKSGAIPMGRLSGIVAHYVPGYLQKNRMPSWETNCISDWEEKLTAITKETLNEKMSLISGIPSWVQMYFEELIKQTGKSNIHEIFPDFSLFIYGGVNYEPYRAKFNKLIGDEVDSIETYPASEGFIAFQDTQKEEGLLLVLNKGIFYEFIPADEFHNEHPTRLSLKDVELDKNYAIILNTNAGLWSYNIGDTIKFVSKAPYRIKVTGRIKHFISAFGEHVIAEEVEKALNIAIGKRGGSIAEFHVAPQVNPSEGLPYHEWFIEFDVEPENMKGFSAELDKAMVELNIYYKDLISGNILRPLVIRRVPKNGFVSAMKRKGKLGGQNKVPRLSNNREMAENLMEEIS